MGQGVQRRGPTVHFAFRRVLADQVGGLLRGLRRQAPTVAVVDGAVRDGRRVQHGLHVHGGAHTPLLVVGAASHAADRDHGLRAAHRDGRIVATLQWRPTHVVPCVRIVLRDAFGIEDVRGSRPAIAERCAADAVLHAAFAQVAGRFDDVASRGGREHEARSLDHGGDDNAHGLSGTGRPQDVDVSFRAEPHLHVPRIAHIPCRMPWARTNGARLAVTEILKHARQDGGKHVTVDGAWSIVGGDLTPGCDARSGGDPVGGAFLGITVRVPEDPQDHDEQERDGEYGQGEQRPREHAALDEQEHDHGEDQREHAHHRAGTDHEMAFLVAQPFQQVRVAGEPFARLGRFEFPPHAHDLAAVVRVEFLTVVAAACRDPVFRHSFLLSIGLFRRPCAGSTCRTRPPTWVRRWEGSCVDARVRCARCRSLGPGVGSGRVRPRSDRG